MKGDFTRLPYTDNSPYSRVLMQQGRVQLDSDWNLQVELAAKRERETLKDFIGEHGGPSNANGFEISAWTGVKFDRPTESFVVEDSNELLFEGEAPFTIESWILVSASSGAGSIVSTWDETRKSGYELGIDSQRRLVFKRSELDRHHESIHDTEDFFFGNLDLVAHVHSPVERTLSSHRALDTDRFCQVCVSFDGSTLRLYIDGKLVANCEHVGRAPHERNPFRLGGFTGKLSNTRIWNRYLSDKAILNLAKRKGRAPGGCVAEYPFSDGSGDELQNRANPALNAKYSEEDDPGAQPSWFRELWVGKGRYYVDGMLCTCDRARPLTEFSVAQSRHQHFLLYLQVWERIVTGFEDASIREVAIPGDTSVRLETVAKIQQLPLRLDAAPTKNVEEIPQWKQHLAASRSTGRMRARRQGFDHEIDNLLYRVEVNSAGVPRSAIKSGGPHPGSVLVENWDATTRALSVAHTIADGRSWSHGDILELWTGPKGSPTVPEIARVSAVDASGRILTLENSPNLSSQSEPWYTRRLPTYKWSKLNGSHVYGVSAITLDGVVQLTQGYPERITINIGDWIEISDAAAQNSDSSAALYKVANIDEVQRTLSLENPGALAFGTPAPGSNLIVRCWDQVSGVTPWGCVPMRTVDWGHVESGIEIEFDGTGLHQPGDYWTIPSRQVLSGIEWPIENGSPKFLPPQGERPVFAPLALVTVHGNQLKVAADLRRTFACMTEQAVSEGDFVRRSGDTMTGQLVIESSLRVSEDASFGGELLAQNSGVFRRHLHAEELYGRLQDNSVDTDQLADGSVTTEKLAFDLPAEFVGGSIIRGSRNRVPGYRFIGSQFLVYPTASRPTRSSGQTLTRYAVGLNHRLFIFDSENTWLLDPQTGQFETLPSIPLLRPGFALAAIDDEVFVIGGQGSSEVLVFSIDSGVWRVGKQAPFTVHNSAAVSIGEHVFVAGGEKRFLFFKFSTREFWRYCTKMEDWRQLPGLPGSRTNLFMGRNERDIFLFGGARKLLGGLLGSRTLDSGLRFDLQSETWNPTDPMPVPLQGLQCGELGGDLVVCGGRGRSLRFPLLFNKAVNRWTPTDQIRLSKNACAATVDDTLYEVLFEKEGVPSAIPIAKTYFVFEPEFSDQNSLA